MLDTFRQASKTWIVKLLFALLVLSFLAWGVGDVVRSGFGTGPAVEVGHTTFTANDVNVEFKRELERLQPMFGGKLTSDEARKLGLLDRTIETMVTRTLIDEAAQQLKLSSSNDMVVARVAADPGFHNQQGKFDPDLLRRALARNGMSEGEFLKIEKKNMLRQQLAEGVSAGLSAPKTLVEPLARWREEKRVAETTIIRADSTPLPPAPDAATLEAYYKANGQRFMAPEYRAVTVLTMSPDMVAGEVEITPEMIAESYQSRSDEFNTPERREVQQIVLTDEAAAAKAGDLVKTGKDLAAVAKDSGAKIVDLGPVEPGDLPDVLAEAVYNAKVGTTIEPVKSPLGWHVAKVTKVTPKSTRALADVRPQIEHDLRREKALERLSDIATKVEDALSGGESLEDLSARLGLRLQRISALDAKGLAPNGKPVADLPKSETFLDVAFHTEPSTESQLTDAEGEGYFLVRIDSVTPPQPKALADIRGELIGAWQAEKRNAQAKERADKLAEQIKSGDTPLAKLASGAGLTVANSTPFTREGAEAAKLPGSIVTDLFKAAPGGIAMAAVPDGWMVARLARVIPFDPAAQTQTVVQTSRRLTTSLSSDLIDQYIAALNADIGVRVDRSQLARGEN